jgi:hypothetical protein
VPSMRQPGSQVTSNRAGAKDQNVHSECSKWLTAFS